MFDPSRLRVNWPNLALRCATFRMSACSSKRIARGWVGPWSRARISLIWSKPRPCYSPPPAPTFELPLNLSFLSYFQRNVPGLPRAKAKIVRDFFSVRGELRMKAFEKTVSQPEKFPSSTSFGAGRNESQSRAAVSAIMRQWNSCALPSADASVFSLMRQPARHCHPGAAVKRLKEVGITPLPDTSVPDQQRFNVCRSHELKHPASPEWGICILTPLFEMRPSAPGPSTLARGESQIIWRSVGWFGSP